MPPHDPSLPPAPPQKNAVARYLAPLVLLVAVIAVLTWVLMHNPRGKSEKLSPPPKAADKKLLEFTRVIAQWSNQEQKVESGVKEVYPFKDFETGRKGFYDFPFKNVAGEAIEVVFYSSSCDCASVEAYVLAGEEWDQISKAFADKPADPIVYANAPAWLELVKDLEWPKFGKDAKEKKRLLVKPDEGGVVRVRWVAKAPGMELKVMPVVWFQPVGEASRRAAQPLVVPVMVAPPVHFHPARVHVGVLSSGARVKTKIYAWSSTREHLDLKLTTNPADPLFETELEPLSKKECAELEAAFRSDPGFKAAKIAPRVVSAQRVSVTVYESQAGRQLDLGSFLRKLEVMLDNIPQPDVRGPEIVGSVFGEISIGGADDQGKIRFKSFSAKEGATKTVELSADPRWQLEWLKADPAWVKVQLTRDAKQEDPKRATWHLEVTVPENTPAAHSFEEPNAVILRIVGPPERFVRIPIEGHMTGR